MHRIVEGNKLTVFDNRKFETSENSRALIFKIDDQNKTADLIHTISHEPEIRSKNMGNVQLTSNKNFVIGWGNTGRKSFYMSEVDTAGNTTSNDSLVSQSFIYSYRAFKFPVES